MRNIPGESNSSWEAGLPAVVYALASFPAPTRLPEEVTEPFEDELGF